MKESLLFAKIIYLLSQLIPYKWVTAILPIANDTIDQDQIVIIAKAFGDNHDSVLLRRKPGYLSNCLALISFVNKIGS